MSLLAVRTHRGHSGESAPEDTQSGPIALGLRWSCMAPGGVRARGASRERTCEPGLGNDALVSESDLLLTEGDLRLQRLSERNPQCVSSGPEGVTLMKQNESLAPIQ